MLGEDRDIKDLRVRVKPSHSFFSQFFRWLGHEILELRVIDTIRARVIFQDYKVTDPDYFAKKCMEYNGKYQVYFSAQPRDGEGGSYENVPTLAYVPIDIDAVRPNKKTEPANAEQRWNVKRNMARILGYLRTRGVQPSMVVDTGNGGLIMTKVPPKDTRAYFYKTGDSVQNTLSDMVNYWLQHEIKPLCDDTVEVDSVALWDLIESCWKHRKTKEVTAAATKTRDVDALLAMLPPSLREGYEKPTVGERSDVLVRTLLHLANKHGLTREECITAMNLLTRKIGRDRWPAAQQYDKLLAEGKIRAHTISLGEYTLKKVGSNVVFYREGEAELSFPIASISGLRVKRKIAEKLGLEEEVVDRAIAKFVSNASAKTVRSYARRQNPELAEKAEKILRDPELVLHIVKALRELGLVGETRNALTTFFDILSTKTGWPINRRWSGRSGMGKTTIIMKVAELFPPEMLKIYTGASKKTLWYDPEAVEVDESTREVSLEGKALILLEESESKEFLDEVKPLLSHDRRDLEYAFVEKFGGVNVTRKVRVHGWPAYIGLTTKTDLSEEQQTRALLGTPDYGRDKYRAVIATDAEKGAAPWLFGETDLPEVIQEAIRRLKPYKVWIPWLHILAALFPYEEPRTMRDWRFLRSFLESITILYQYQVPHVKIRGEEYLAAPLTVLELAAEIGKAGFEETISKLPRDVKEFARYLAEHEAPFWTYKSLQKEYSKCFGGSIGRTTLRERYVEKLQEEGLIEIDDTAKPYKIRLTGERLASLTVFEKSLEIIRSVGKNYLLNHLGLSAEGGRIKLLEIMDPHGNSMTVDELTDILYTPSLAVNVKEAISRSRDKEYALPELFLKSVKDANAFLEKKGGNGELKTPTCEEGKVEAAIKETLIGAGGSMGTLAFQIKLEKRGFDWDREVLPVLVKLEDRGKIHRTMDTISLGPEWIKPDSQSGRRSE